MQITLHGYSFEIDTADWGRNSDSAHKGEQHLISFLHGFGPVGIAEIWRAAKNRGEDMAGTDQIEAAEARAFALAMDGWVSCPDTGHNMFIVAID